MSASKSLLKFNIARSSKLKEKLSQSLAWWVGRDPIGIDFVSMIDDIAQHIPNVDVEALTKSLQPLAGCAFTKEHLKEVVWRIVGNLDKLKAGNIVPEWQFQPEVEWCPIQVMDVRKKLAKRQDKIVKAAELELLILAGWPAGKLVTKTFVENYLSSVFVRETFGFSKFDSSKFKRYATKAKTYPFNDITELTHMKFYGCIEPELSIDNPNFKEIDNSSTFKKQNRLLINYRTRDEFECPKNYNVSSRPCHMCEVGYDECIAACHPKTYSLIGHCPVCNTQGAYFDTSRSYGKCVDCLSKSLG